MSHKRVDLTSEIVDSKMYSFDRAAYTFWNGFANALLKEGYTESQALTILGSTYIRHYLDQTDDRIEKLGVKMGKAFIKDEGNARAVDMMLRRAAGGN